MPTPTVGRTVLYRLSASDCADINRRRKDFSNGPGYADRTGYIGHVGNEALEGAVCPATIVRVWDDAEITCNLQVHLDGNDTFWATSRKEGNDVAQWSWPEVK
ncbi:hypothetical protein ACLGIH_19870 [Streptomyces sp. HMX87]|uniref:hypothetical protein n=1 Tax=Streptomyces sp. HMX87 TaxID=3390849 RepID=UPI003A8B9EF1